jgi:hypothetical protein
LTQSIKKQVGQFYLFSNSSLLKHMSLIHSGWK